MPSRRKLAEERRGRAGAMQARNFATCGSGIMLRRFPGSLRFMILAATAVVLAAPSAVAQTRAPSKPEGHACADEDFPWASGPGALSLGAHHGELQAPTPQSADGSPDQGLPSPFSGASHRTLFFKVAGTDLGVGLCLQYHGAYRARCFGCLE